MSAQDTPRIYMSRVDADASSPEPRVALEFLANDAPMMLKGSTRRMTPRTAPSHDIDNGWVETLSADDGLMEVRVNQLLPQ